MASYYTTSSSASMSGIVDLLRQTGVYPAEVEARLTDEVFDAIRECPTVVPRNGTLTRNDGSTQTLLSLAGTVPIYYRGNPYNIPVTIWVTEFHPHIAPLAYVTPTKNMMVKPRHRHVDTAGKVHHQYLTDWDASRSSISGLLGVLASVFSSEPPVYARAHQNVDLESRRKKELLEQARDKIRQAMLEHHDDVQAQVVRLVGDRESLRSSQSTIEEGLSGLSLEHNSAESRVHALHREEAELDRWLEANAYLAREVDIEDIMEEADMPTRQILENLADDLAIQDALYVLDEVVENGSIDFTTFLRETRKLCRDQFFSRAMLRKVKLSRAEAERSSR